MTGKTIHELTTAELRSECTVHGSSISGSKPDLMIRLEDNIREIGQDPVNVRFSCVQPLIVRSTCSTDEQPYATSTRIETVASQFNRRPSAGNVVILTAQQSPTEGQPRLSEPQPFRQQSKPAQDTANNIFKPQWNSCIC